MVQQMLAGLFIVGGFFPIIMAESSLTLLTNENNVITGRFIDFLLISLPSCVYGGQNVDVEYQNVNTSQTNTLTNIFTVAYCQSSGSSSGLLAVRRRLGYQLTGLNSNTEYKIRYKIGSTYSNYLMATTRKVFDHKGINTGLSGWSAAMIVITATLSVAMFFLLLSFILSLVLSNNGH
ncbi:uncharacterized protein upk2 [Trichomycterus rosablanca]|uniref:uncharacterized protein upk2 n=1 Tax=Trichomycterus rosablanca TaxID=2290929 RepID=UPI002F355688